MNHKEFEVVDSKTGENLTKSILLQIITEQESNDQQAVLTQTVLKQLIRFYGSDMQTFMRQYLEQSVSVFLERQDALQHAVTDLMGGSSPLAAFNKMMEHNMGWWRQFASFDPLTGARKEATEPGSNTGPKAPDEHKDDE